MSDIVSVYKSVAPPFPVAVVASTYLLSMKDSLGIDDHYTALYDIVTDKSNDLNFLTTDIERVSTKVVETLIANPSLVTTCRDQYLHHITKAYALLNRDTLPDRLAQMSGVEIAQLFQEAIKEYALASYYVEPPNFSLEIAGHDLVQEKFRQYFEQQGIKLESSAFASYFSTMISFTEMSFVQASELSLLHIALLEGEEQEEAIREHEHNYYWKLYDYYGPILDVATIKEELQPLLELPRSEIEKRIQKIIDSVPENEKQLANTQAQYPLPPDLRTAAQVIRDFGYVYSDLKKQHTSRVNVGFGELLKFLAKQYDLDLLSLHYATYQELRDLAQGTQTVTQDTLRARMVASVVSCQLPDQYFLFLNEIEAQAIVAKSGKPAEKVVTLLKGMPANSGIYTGLARVVINMSQIGKVQPGDVLVAPMTTVGYVPAMKKAGAIITDIGGITSHAAIVSRELGVPCIVGLKIATTTFKDGDMVEVDANHGLARKV